MHMYVCMCTVKCLVEKLYRKTSSIVKFHDKQFEPLQWLSGRRGKGAAGTTRVVVGGGRERRGGGRKWLRLGLWLRLFELRLSNGLGEEDD